ncbi:Zinc finger protein RME1 [Colletotrichum orbiculare MAFF 240422]|uniref:Zinc finger protein RME1 n=1 Tax=Colletotrichum orbiculare (strain 104-T / ATCC 96160 / CBS 514.97 / LARS 414 / MAFF 240422) TaxID=1213857 RepID=A0A484FVJ7_COLOR|nr:Zinc finger protein RME1 [Colletotrichum orbiculare MAFF 240422]
MCTQQGWINVGRTSAELSKDDSFSRPACRPLSVLCGDAANRNGAKTLLSRRSQGTTGDRSQGTYKGWGSFSRQRLVSALEIQVDAEHLEQVRITLNNSGEYLGETLQLHKSGCELFTFVYLSASLNSRSTSLNTLLSSPSVGGGRPRGLGGMAADPQSLPDPALDSAIRQLLDQQADIQARLAVLLPAKYGTNVKVELNMLRHKLRALQLYSDHHQISANTPVVSELEEARSLQYRCECIETACLEQGHDLSDPSTAEVLKRPLHDEAPAGYDAWLDRNLRSLDPVVQGWRFRDNLSPSSRSALSFKCWDERCIHYIYGFFRKEDRDGHVREHSVHIHRDSGMSVGNTPPLPFADYPTSRPWGSETGRPSLSVQLPKPATDAQLAPIATSSLSRDRRDPLQSYSLSGEHTGLGRGSVDSEIDPLLPPLKRSRVGQSRLQSIGELRLLQDSGPCLRCIVTKQPCDSREPCFYCADQPLSPSSEFWKTLGCHRGPLVAFADALLPGVISPSQAKTPLTSPLAQRRSINEHLESMYRLPPELLHTVESSLDYDDGFWWTEELAGLTYSKPQLSSFSRQPVERPPPILSILAASWNGSGTSYSFLHLLKTSGMIAATREVEEAVYPALYKAKLLLREIIIWDLQQFEPSIHLEGALPHRPLLTNDIDHDAQYRMVHNCMAQFLQAYESAMLRPGLGDPKSWLAVFIALCIFSAIRTILVDVGPRLPRPEERKTTSRYPNTLPNRHHYRHRYALRQPMVPSQLSSPSSRTLDNRTRCPHPDCGRVFKDLAAHMLTHQEERPEKCPIETCEYHIKGFARKYDKNRHALTHYKGTMICPFCPGVGTAYEKAFNRADVFKRHLTSVHNVEQTPPNSRKLIISGSGNVVGEGAKCSICQSYFGTAQEFYEHLDDCVLNVIVPSSAKTPSGSSVLRTTSGLEERERLGEGDLVDRRFHVEPGSPVDEKMDTNL